MFGEPPRQRFNQVNVNQQVNDVRSSLPRAYVQESTTITVISDYQSTKYRRLELLHFELPTLMYCSTISACLT